MINALLHKRDKIIHCKRIYLQFIRNNNNNSFISQHYNIDGNELKTVIDSMNTLTRINKDNNIEVKECKLCPKGNKSKSDNIWKLTIRPSNGSYYCFRCSESGNWFQLKSKVNNILNIPIKSSYEILNQSNNNTKEIFKNILLSQEIYRSYYHTLFPANDLINLNDDVKSIRKYLFEVRQLRKEILMKYGVGMTYQPFLDDNNQWVNKLCITFPWLSNLETDPVPTQLNELRTDINGNFLIHRIKCRALETKGLQRLLPKGGNWGFFGWHTVKSYHKHIIITEGEYDAMAVNQALSDITDKNHKLFDIPSISLPNGCSSLPLELLPQLERFEKIYLWLDNDKPGIENSDKIAKKLGLYRTFIVRPDSAMKNPPKDANDALRQNIDNIIPNLLENAKIMSHEKLQSFNDYKDEVIRAIRQTSLKEGTQTPSLPKLTDICKGFRRGELVIFTGPTGVGKTTLLSQLSLDFVKQGIPTLWGSFEIKNKNLLLKMLHQYYSNGSLKNLSDDQINQIFNDFEQLPLKFMNFHGGSNIDDIIEVMDNAVYSYDIYHIIIDNLQFMTIRNTNINLIEKLYLQDIMIDKLRKFCTEKNVNIILVIHPRKEDENIGLSMASISGTAKATQESDLVMILQKINDNIYLDIKKNRYDGIIGKIDLKFSPISLSYYETLIPNKLNNSNNNVKKVKEKNSDKSDNVKEINYND